MRWPLVVVLLLCAAALSWLFVDGSDSNEPIPSAPAAAGDEWPAAAALAVPDAASSAKAHEGGRRVEGAPTEASASQRSEVRSKSFGTLVLVDPDGVEHRDRSGTLRVHVESGTSCTVEIPVLGGRFEIPSPGPLVTWQVQAVEVEAIQALVDLAASLVEPADGMEIRAFEVPTNTLRVVDASHGRELDRVTIARGEELERPRWRPAHIAGVVHKEVASPVPVLPRMAESGVQWEDGLWIGAAGFAWTHRRVDYRLGRELRVELVPAGGLEVLLSGAIPTGPKHDGDTQEQASERDRRWRQGVRVRLYREDKKRKATAGAALIEELRGDRPWGRVVEARVRDWKQAVSMDGVEPGDYLACVERGSYWNNPLVLGAAKATVRAGSSERVLIELIQQESTQAVPLRGVLECSAEWELAKPTLEFHPTSGDGKHRWLETAEVKGQPGHFTWDAGRVRAGKYLFELGKVGQQWMLDVGSDGMANARLVVTDPADVIVRLVDADSGLAPSDVKLYWASARAHGSNGGSLSVATFDAKSGTHNFRCGVGKVDLDVAGLEWRRTDRNALVVRPGHNEFVVRVRRATGVRITLRDGKHRIPIDSEATKLLDAKGESAAWGWGESDGVLSIYTKEAGRYTLKITAPPGYAPIEPLALDLRPGLEEKTVELRRQ